MKKKITLILLPVFIFSIIGWQWMFILKLFSHEAKEWGRESQRSGLEAVVVSKISSGSTFFVNKHELIHDGKLYDVKWKEKKGDAWICYCEHDGAEENMMTSFDVKTKDAFDNSFSQNSKTNKVVKLSLFESTMPFLLVPPVPDHHDFVSSLETLFCFSSVVDSFFVPPDIA